MCKNKSYAVLGKKHYHATMRNKIVQSDVIVSSSSIKYFIDNYDFANKEMNYFVDIILGLECLDFNFSYIYDIDMASYREFKTSLLKNDTIYTSKGWKFYEGEFDQFLPNGKGSTFYKDGTPFIKGEFANGVLLINKPFSLFLPNGVQIVKNGNLLHEANMSEISNNDNNIDIDIDIIIV